MSVLGWVTPHCRRKEFPAWPADDLYSSALSPALGLWSQEPGPRWAGYIKEHHRLLIVASLLNHSKFCKIQPLKKQAGETTVKTLNSCDYRLGLRQTRVSVLLSPPHLCNTKNLSISIKCKAFHLNHQGSIWEMRSGLSSQSLACVKPYLPFFSGYFFPAEDCADLQHHWVTWWKFCLDLQLQWLFKDHKLGQSVLSFALHLCPLLYTLNLCWYSCSLWHHSARQKTKQMLLPQPMSFLSTHHCSFLMLQDNKKLAGPSIEQMISCL